MTSVHHLVPSQPLQARAVGLPVGAAGSRHTPIVVEVYALGVGVTLVREGHDLCSAQGTLELEANGIRVVIDPLRSRKTEWLVAPIERDVAAIGLALQTVNQDELAQLGHGFFGSHGTTTSWTKTAILSLPAGWGKTTLAHPLAAFLGCTQIVDEWEPTQPITPCALHLTHVLMVGSAT